MKLSVPPEIKFDDLKQMVNDGAKFITYRYIISMPFFRPTKRFSKFYLILNDEKRSKHSFKYNLLNLLLGFWGWPFGPPYMVNSIIANLKGGFDFTDDVMENITADSFSKRIVTLEKPAKYFSELSSSNKKELIKVFKKLRSDGIIENEIIAGYYINVSKDERPYHVIGVYAILNDKIIAVIKNEILKRFFKHARFDVVSLLDDKYEHIERLKKEGTTI